VLFCVNPWLLFQNKIYFFLVRVPPLDLEPELLLLVEPDRPLELLPEDLTLLPEPELLGRYVDPPLEDELRRTRLGVEALFRVVGFLTVEDEEFLVRLLLILVPVEDRVGVRDTFSPDEDFRTRLVVIPGWADESEFFVIRLLDD